MARDGNFLASCRPQDLFRVTQDWIKQSDGQPHNLLAGSKIDSTALLETSVIRH
jgi:hypothetical protein